MTPNELKAYCKLALSHNLVITTGFTLPHVWFFENLTNKPHYSDDPEEQRLQEWRTANEGKTNKAVLVPCGSWNSLSGALETASGTTKDSTRDPSEAIDIIRLWRDNGIN